MESDKEDAVIKLNCHVKVPTHPGKSLEIMSFLVKFPSPGHPGKWLWSLKVLEKLPFRSLNMCTSSGACGMVI